MKKLLHILGWVLRILSVIGALGLLFAYLSRYISPAFTWFFAFFGLIFPQLVILNTVLFLFWLLLKQKTCLIHLAIILPAFFFLPAYVQLWRNAEPPADKQTELKVLTYNVHLFGINAQTKSLRTLPEIAEFITRESPDVICLQEVGMFDTMSIKRAFRAYPYTHFHARRLSNNTWFATATLSRFPVREKGAILFPKTGNVSIYTDITVQGQTLRVYNNHLESTGLNLSYSFARLKQEDKRNEEIIKVSTRLRDAFVKRAQQVDTVAAHIAASPFPVLVCGDFNDFPMSYTYRKMKGKLSDAFVAAGAGIPTSFRNRWPVFRIDYIFSDRFFQASHFYIPQVDYSDHYPVVAIFTLNNT